MTLNKKMFKKNVALIAKTWGAWEKSKPPFDANGHILNTTDSTFMFNNIIESKENVLRRLLQAIESRVPTLRPIIFPRSVLNTCFNCGEAVEFETNGITIRPRNSCKYPNGVPLSFELNVPSGVMIVGNDFRGHFDISKKFNTNTRMGSVKTTKAMEAIGCAHAYVGNSCPDMYRIGKDSFIIASSGYKVETKEEIVPQGVRVATITTNLRWYSIVDGVEFKKRGCEGKYQADKVKVRPGVYQFMHLMHLDHAEDDEQPFIYTKIEWVRPSDKKVKK